MTALSVSDTGTPSRVSVRLWIVKVEGVVASDRLTLIVETESVRGEATGSMLLTTGPLPTGAPTLSVRVCETALPMPLVAVNVRL